VPALPAFPDALPKLSFSPDGTWGLGLTPGSSVAATLPTGKGKKRVSVVTEETEDQLDDSDANSGSAVETEEDEDATIHQTPMNGDVSPKSQPQDAKNLEKLRPPNTFARKDSAASVASSVSKYSTEDNDDVAENTPTMPSLPVIVETVPSAPLSPTLPTSPPAAPSTIYLQLGRDMKKAKLDPHEPITFASLRMLFTDKFAYNPGLADFPAIYLRHPSSGVQYELEDLEEIKDHSVLSLNIERES
jgi:hypothetical protein